jgi:hypothetical protein
MKKTKCNLEQVKVQSFVTSFQSVESETLKAGGSLFGSCAGNGATCAKEVSCIPIDCFAGATEEGAPGCAGTV